MGTLRYPIEVSGHYEIKTCQPPTLIRYLSQTREAGFATERTLRLEETSPGTIIRVDSFVVGEPKISGGAAEFLSKLSKRWIDDFAGFCDVQAEGNGNRLKNGADERT